ncbi:MAG: hypothetical protein WB789_03165 [Thermoplasmata archaeon]
MTVVTRADGTLGSGARVTTVLVVPTTAVLLPATPVWTSLLTVSTLSTTSLLTTAGISTTFLVTV